MFREGLRPPDPFAAGRHAFEAALTQDGMSLKSLSELGAVLAVCLPPRAWLAALAEQRPAIEAAGARIVIVGAEAQGELAYVARIDAPSAELLDALELAEKEPGLLDRVRGRGATRPPGAFVLRDGEITRAHREPKPPDFAALL